MIRFMDILWKQMFGYATLYGPSGSTGKVSYPTHMEDIHKDWLAYSGSPTAITTDFISVMDSALASNPLGSMSYTDPSTDITAIDNEMDEFNTEVDALDTQADFNSIVDNAVTKVDEAGVLNDIDIATLISDARSGATTSLQEAVTQALNMVDDVLVKKAIQDFIRNREAERARMKTRYKANMSSISAERSSAYAIGLALLETDFERQVNQFQTEFTNQLYQQGIQFYANALAREIQQRLRAESVNKQNRDDILMRSIQTDLQYKQFVVEMGKQVVAMLTESKRVGYVMDSEYTHNQMDLNWKHDTWDMQVYKNGITILGGLGGGQFVPEGPSATQSAIGGALQGAGTGAAVGSVVPGIGTAVGAGVGAAMGAAPGIIEALGG